MPSDLPSAVAPRAGARPAGPAHRARPVRRRSRMWVLLVAMCVASGITVVALQPTSRSGTLRVAVPSAASSSPGLPPPVAGRPPTTLPSASAAPSSSGVPGSGDPGSGDGSPSGAAVPVGDLPGWRQLFADDFTGTSLAATWGRYSGSPGGDPITTWSPAQVSVRDGALVLRSSLVGGRPTAGGVSNHLLAQTYGRWDVRFRVDRSDDMTYALLLWPDDDVWPPEIDFAEDGGGDRSLTTSSAHHGAENSQEQRTVQADFSQWHTVGVQWLPGEITYTLDGEVWGRVVGEAVPAVPMWMALQVQAGGCQRNPAARCPLAGSPAVAELEVDWVSVYAPG